MNISKYKIKIVPFTGNNYAKNENDIIERIISFIPITEDGIINVTKNNDNIEYNSTGLVAYCCKILNDNEVELKINSGIIYGKIEGIQGVY
jgi:hypothetical protein